MTSSWLVRAASRPQDGAGHVSRCRILARALSRHASTTLVLDAPAKSWRDRIRGESFNIEEAEQAPLRQLEGAVVDAYDLPGAVWKSLRQQSRLLVQFDDFLSPHPNVDMVINAAPHLQGDTVDGCPALLGPAYALVDPAFVDVRREPSEVVSNIYVGFGMADPANATGLCLEALALIGRKFDITVTLGSAAPHLPSVRTAATKIGARLSVDACNVPDMLSRTDIAIGAGGVGLLERMAAGVPTISLAIADNQMAFLHGAAERRGTRYLGRQTDISARQLADEILTLADDHQARRAMSRQASALVDGGGDERVAAALVARARATS